MVEQFPEPLAPAGGVTPPAVNGAQQPSSRPRVSGAEPSSPVRRFRVLTVEGWAITVNATGNSGKPGLSATVYDSVWDRDIETYSSNLGTAKRKAAVLASAVKHADMLEQGLPIPRCLRGHPKIGINVANSHTCLVCKHLLEHAGGKRVGPPDFCARCGCPRLERTVGCNTCAKRAHDRRRRAKKEAA